MNKPQIPTDLFHFINHNKDPSTHNRNLKIIHDKSKDKYKLYREDNLVMNKIDVINVILGKSDDINHVTYTK